MKAKLFGEPAKAERRELEKLDKHFASLGPEDFAPPAQRQNQVPKLACNAIRHEFERVIEQIEKKLTELEVKLADRKKQAHVVIEALRETADHQAASLEMVFAEMEHFEQALTSALPETQLPALPPLEPERQQELLPEDHNGQR